MKKSMKELDTALAHASFILSRVAYTEHKLKSLKKKLKEANEIVRYKQAIAEKDLQKEWEKK